MAEDLNKSTYYSARILIKRSVNGQNLSMQQVFRRICWTDALNGLRDELRYLTMYVSYFIR